MKKEFEPRYAAICRAIRGELRAGKWIKGERLPSEKELCRIYGVSRITIVHALAELEKEGFIARRRGSGTYVLWTPEFDYYTRIPVCGKKSGRIRIVHSLLAASPLYKFLMKQLAGTFMKVNPDVEIEFLYLSPNQSDDPYLSRIMTGNVPTCGEFFWYAAYTEQNALLPLEQLDGFDTLRNSLLPSVIPQENSHENKSKIYAVQFNIDFPSSILINMNWVERAGIRLPEKELTWKSFFRLQKALAERNRNTTSFHAVGLEYPESYHCVKPYVELMGQEILAGKYNPYDRDCLRRIIFSEGAEKGLNLLQGIRDGKGVIFEKSHEHFALGEIGILPFSLTWSFRLLDMLNAHFPIRNCLLPPVYGKAYHPFHSGFSLGLFRDGIHSTEQRNAAWSWLKFLLFDSSQELCSGQSFQFPVKNGIRTVLAERFPACFELAEKQQPNARPQFDFVGMRSDFAQIGENLKAFLQGKYDAVHCLKKIRERFSAGTPEKQCCRSAEA